MPSFAFCLMADGSLTERQSIGTVSARTGTFWDVVYRMSRDTCLIRKLSKHFQKQRPCILRHKFNFSPFPEAIKILSNLENLSIYLLYSFCWFWAAHLTCFTLSCRKKIQSLVNKSPVDYPSNLFLSLTFNYIRNDAISF